LGNESAIYVVQADSSVMATPEGVFVLYITMEVPLLSAAAAIGEANLLSSINKDESEPTAAEEETSLKEEDGNRTAWKSFVKDNGTQLSEKLRSVVAMLQSKTKVGGKLPPATLNEGVDGCFKELFHVTTVRPLFYEESLQPPARVPTTTSPSAEQQPITREAEKVDHRHCHHEQHVEGLSISKENDSEQASAVIQEGGSVYSPRVVDLARLPNVAVVGDTSSHLSMDSYIDQARAVFTKLFPGVAFLPEPSSTDDDNGGEGEEGGESSGSRRMNRTNDDDDDGDSLMLQNTLNIFDKQAEETPELSSTQAVPDPAAEISAEIHGTSTNVTSELLQEKSPSPDASASVANAVAASATKMGDLSEPLK
jgi:hypothetical protein